MDIEVDHDAIGVQVSKDWQDADIMQECGHQSGTALSFAPSAVGAGVGGHTDGLAKLVSALQEVADTMDVGFTELAEAFYVLGSADTAVGDNYDEVEAINRRMFKLYGPSARQIA